MMKLQDILDIANKCTTEANSKQESPDFARGVRHVINDLALLAQKAGHEKVADQLTELALSR